MREYVEHRYERPRCDTFEGGSCDCGAEAAVWMDLEGKYFEIATRGPKYENAVRDLHRRTYLLIQDKQRETGLYWRELSNMLITTTHKLLRGRGRMRDYR